MPLTQSQENKLRKYRQQGYKAETAAARVGCTATEARQFWAQPRPPRPARQPKPKPTSYSHSMEAALDTSEAHYARVRWAAREALAETLRKRREAIAAARQ